MPGIKERPILFNGQMVSAVLDGRKTVTRRALSARSLKEIGYGVQLGECHELPADGKVHPNSAGYYADLCPFGRPGERLWVRETWGVISHGFDEHGNTVDWAPDRPATPIREMRFGRGYYSGHAIYRADGEMAWAGDDDGGGDDRSAWKPSIHMPRIASRILLEITAVRVEPLQHITIGQILKEGLARSMYEFIPVTQAFDAFAELWNSTGGDWEANPWVWVVEFKQVSP